MKTKLLILIALFSLPQGVSAQDWQWASSAGGSSHDGPGDQLMCLDNSGSSYYCGTFFSNPCYFHTDTLVPNGQNDIFIAKYDANGNEIWVKGFGGNSNNAWDIENVFSICYNGTTNTILITGYYYGMAILGNDTLYGFPSGGFMASLDTAGSFNWVKKDAALIATEGDDFFYGIVSFRSGGIIDTIPVASGVWLSKYSVQGNILWVRKIFSFDGTDFDAMPARIKVKEGRIFAIGSSHNDTFTVDTITVHANFPSDQYIIACFDTSGSALWVKPTSGRNSHYISDIEVDNELNSYITGPVVGDAIFDGDTIHTGGWGFLAKYDSLGNFQWVNNTPHLGQGYDLALDKENTIYLVTAVYDTANLCNSTLIGASNGNPLLVRYDSNGSCISFFESSIDMGISSVQCDSNNSVIITGAFFNTTTLGSTTITCLGTANSYIAKMDALTGIGEGERKTNNLLIYANPNEGKCNIIIPDEFKNEKNLTLSIFDNTGKLIQQGTVEMNEEKVRVNLEAEAKGIYNVKLSNGKKSYGGKIVFE